ncbi:MAG: UDP-4-amino-4,6-dideoxy-N-acetyl-beta-L-altrosamine transaminase [Elusimicrobia bacterium]|nr:UDP-4-amino-4,6-dideoxy-N-acetyl-beta-L-altrosamine transaminase [Elusimicrobiota bacterium]
MAKPIPYGRQFLDASDLQAVLRVLKSDWLTQGPSVGEFEAALAKSCGAKYAVACSNGTAALHLACMAAGLKPGDEAITSPITFAATANAVLYCGAKPVFADVEADTLNLDPELAEKAVTPKTRAMLAVHFGGQPADMKTLGAIARENNLILIEDAAHALGARQNGEKVGSCKHSDMATMSFHPVKHITTGEGGAILTNREDLYQKLRLLRTHGITRDPSMLEKQEGPWYYEMHALGFNYRITDFQCALGSTQLAKLPKFIKRRREIASMYDKAFRGMPELKPVLERKGNESSYHLYILKVSLEERRRAFFEALQARGLQPNVHYIPVHKLPYYRKNGYEKVSMPVAEDYYSRAVTIPLYPSMTNVEVNRVIKAVKDAAKAAA